MTGYHVLQGKLENAVQSLNPVDGAAVIQVPKFCKLCALRLSCLSSQNAGLNDDSDEKC